MIISKLLFRGKYADLGDTTHPMYTIKNYPQRSEQ